MASVRNMLHEFYTKLWNRKDQKEFEQLYQELRSMQDASELDKFKTKLNIILVKGLGTSDVQNDVIAAGNPKLVTFSMPETKRTLFHAAARKSEGIMEILICALRLVWTEQQENDRISVHDEPDESGVTPMMEAVALNKDEIVKLLLKPDASDEANTGCLVSPAQVDRKDDNGNTAFHYACSFDALESFKVLSGHLTPQASVSEVKLTDMEREENEFGSQQEVVKPLLNWTNLERKNPLHLAATKNSVRVMKHLMEQRALQPEDVDKEMDDIPQNDLADDENRSEQLTPLGCAAKEGHDEMVKLLLSLGADPTKLCLVKDNFSLDREDRSPLMIAAKQNHIKVCSVLLAHQAERGQLVVGEDETHSLVYASATGSTDLIGLILGYFKEPLQPAQKDVTDAMEVAAGYGNKSVLKLLCDTFPRQIEEAANQILSVGIQCKKYEIVKYILDSGNLDIHKQASPKELLRQPIHVAIECRDATIVGLLVERRADVNAALNDSRTPLALAAHEGNVEVLRILLEHGADPTARVTIDDKRYNSLEIAVKNGNEECALQIIRMFHAQLPEIVEGVRTKIPPMWYRMSSRFAFEESVKNMPAAAEAMLDWMIKKYGSMSRPDFEVVLGHEMVEDSYIDIPENSPKGKTPLEMYYEHSQETPWQDRPESDSDQDDSDVIMDGKGYQFQGINRGSVDFETAQADKTARAKETPHHGKRRQVDELTIRKGAVPFSQDATEREAHNKIKLMISHGQERLLSHPAVLSLLQLKWNQFAKQIYYSLFFIYGLFVVLLTTFASLADAPYLKGNANLTLSLCRNVTKSGVVVGLPCARGTALYYMRFVILALVLANATLEVVQLCMRKKQYLHSIENLFDWIIYTGGAYFMFPSSNRISNSQWYLGSVILCLAWMRLLMFVQQLPQFGLYVVMFSVVMKDFAKFAVVYLLFLFSFMVSFFMLLREHEHLKSFGRLALQMTAMTVGELNLAELIKKNDGETERQSPEEALSSGIIMVLFLCFVVVMTVIVMNLLVGIAVHDISNVFKKAQLQKLQMQAELILDTEIMLPEKWRKHFLRRGRVVPIKVKGRLDHVPSPADQPSVMSKGGLMQALMNRLRNIQ